LPWLPAKFTLLSAQLLAGHQQGGQQPKGITVRKVVVFGLGKFGASVATRLFVEGLEILAVDQDLKLVEQVRDKVSTAIACDATDRANLEAYDIGRMDVAVVAIGSNFEASVLVTLLCKELGVPLIVAKALNRLQQRVLQEVGADQVILPEEEMGSRLAEHLLHESVVDFVELPEGYSLRRLEVPEEWVGRSLAELELLSSKGLNLIQIIRKNPKEGEEPVQIPLPHGEMVLEAGDRIDLIGPDTALNRYLR
jgi:trk system potassium uptake protein TrkA